jgi:hypothetical protein
MRVPPRKLLGLLSLLAALAACGVTPTPVPVNPALTNEIIQALPTVANTTGGALDGTHKPIVGLKLSIEPLALLFTGKGQKQTVRVVARDAQGNIVRLKKKSVTWRISDPKLVKLGNNMGKSEAEPEPDETLEISTNRDDDDNAITISALSDEGLGYVSVRLASNPTTGSVSIPFAVRKFRPGVSVIAASKIVVGTLEVKDGGGFSPQEVAAMRSDYVSSAVVRGAALSVGTLVSLEGPRGGLGRVATSARRSEFNLIGIGLASSTELFEPYNKPWPVAPSASPLTPAGLQAQADPIVPSNPNGCKIIKGPTNIDWSKLINFQNFKLNQEPVGNGTADNFYVGVKITPTGSIGLDPFNAVGGPESLDLKVQCNLSPTLTTPVWNLLIPVPFTPVVIPLPLQGSFTPNITFDINATKTKNLRLGFFVNNGDKKQSLVVQVGGSITVENGIPSFQSYKNFTNEPGNKPAADLKKFAALFQPDLSLVGLVNGFVPAQAAITLDPISFNGAVQVALPTPIDFMNVDATLLKTNIAWANGPSAADTKVQPGAGRTNISYLSAAVSFKSNNAQAIANFLTKEVKNLAKKVGANDFFAQKAEDFAKNVVKKTLGAINDKVKAGIGQNFGEANYVPLKPGALTGGNSAILSVTHLDGTIETVGLKSDGTGKASIQVGDKLELLVLSEAGNPSFTDALGGSLSITNKTRYSGLPTRGNVWDYSNRDTIPANGFPGPFLPFSYQGKSGLATKPGLAVPGNPPTQPPGTDYFYLVGELNSVSKGLCDQVASKGEADWRFTAENVIFPASQTPPAPGLTSSNYLGGVKVTCGNNVDFFAGGDYTSPNLLTQDGQEVLVDCDNAFPIAINFKQGQTITEPRIKYDGVLTVPDPIVLLDGTTLIRSQTTATAQDKANGGGTHTITAEAKGFGGQLKTSKRTFVLKCKEKLPPTINPPTISVRDGFGNDIVLNDGGTTINVPVCPDDPRTFALTASMLFVPNGTATDNKLSIDKILVGIFKSEGGVGIGEYANRGPYSVGSRPFTVSINNAPTSTVTNSASVSASVTVSETAKPANKFEKSYSKPVTISYVAKPANQCSGPLTLSVKDDYNNTVELVDAETVLPIRLCPGGARQFFVQASASFRANENPNSQQLSVARLSIDAKDDDSALGFVQLGAIDYSGPSYVKLPAYTLADKESTATSVFSKEVSFIKVGTGVTLRGTGLAELSVPPFTKATATVVNKHITINYINLPATDSYCQPQN